MEPMAITWVRHLHGAARTLQHRPSVGGCRFAR